MNRRRAALCCAALPLCAFGATARSLAGTKPASEADAAIAFYRSRVGGHASYPAYARLGMAYLQKYIRKVGHKMGPSAK